MFYGYRSIQAAFSFVHRRGSCLLRRNGMIPMERKDPYRQSPLLYLSSHRVSNTARDGEFDNTPERMPHRLLTQLEKVIEIALQLQE
jgi:hypothetical protein